MLTRTCSRLTHDGVHMLVILTLGALILPACQPMAPTFRPPNKNEIQAFARSENLAPIADKLLDDSMVLLFENDTSIGYSILTVREPGSGLKADTAVAAKSDQPILIMAQLTGDHPFAAVVIQDATLAAQSAAIEMALDSKYRLTATTDGRTGVILVSPSPVQDWKTVTLYNALGQVLYQQDHHPVQQLRVANSGKEDLQGLSVLFPGPTADALAVRVEFGDVPAGQTTAYRDVLSGVYPYAAYEYRLPGRVVTQAVVDWMGESPMQGEKFTYRIALDSNKVQGNQVQLLEVLVDRP